MFVFIFDFYLGNIGNGIWEKVSDTKNEKTKALIKILALIIVCCPLKALEKYLRLTKLCIQKDKNSFIVGSLFKIKTGREVPKSHGVSYRIEEEVLKKYIFPS